MTYEMVPESFSIESTKNSSTTAPFPDELI